MWREMANSSPLQSLEVQHTQVFALMFQAFAADTTYAVKPTFSVRVAWQPSRRSETAQGRTRGEFTIAQARQERLRDGVVPDFFRHCSSRFDYFVMSNFPRIEHHAIRLCI